jgi:hypothetical protein
MKKKKRKAKVKVLKPVTLAPNQHLVPVLVEGVKPPEVSSWKAFTNWFDHILG